MSSLQEFRFYQRRRTAGVIALVVMLALVLAMLNSGCASGPVVQTIEVTKATAESILYEARIAQIKGKITDAQFNSIRDVYDKLRAAVNVSIDARIAYLTLQTTDTEQRMTEAVSAVTDMTVQLISLAAQFGLINTAVTNQGAMNLVPAWGIQI